MKPVDFDYDIRISKRAKNVRLTIGRDARLQLVVPEGFDQRRIPALLAQKADWISHALQRAQRLLETRHAAYGDRLIPSEIHLKAIDEQWSIQHHSSAEAYYEQQNGQLQLYANHDSDAVALLQEWLKERARATLPKLLAKYAQNTGLNYRRCSIRLQKTRWGSCSSRGTISLNARILLLTPSLAEYLFIHELCHTRHMNHSAAFWRLVSSYLPDYRQRDQAVNQAGLSLPPWSDP